MNEIIKAKMLLLQCLSQFDTEEENVTETLYNVYPDEMIAIERLIASLTDEEYIKGFKAALKLTSSP